MPFPLMPIKEGKLRLQPYYDRPKQIAMGSAPTHYPPTIRYAQRILIHLYQNTTNTVSSGIAAQPIVMRPIFHNEMTGQVTDNTPPEPEKEKPFSDILRRK